MLLHVQILGSRRPRLRDYELERRRLECPLEECTDKHPLQRIVAVRSIGVGFLSKLKDDTYALRFFRVIDGGSGVSEAF